MTSEVAEPRLAKGHRIRNISALFVICGAVVFLLVQGISGSLNFYETVDEALHHRSDLKGSTFRLEGVVVPGSIIATDSGASFALSEGKHRIDVVNTGTPPQLFQGNIPVVVSGHFTTQPGNHFVSDQILVKHSSSYVAAHPDRVKAKDGTVR
jgi:cytochrome c-type biogenesis protein CcmE